VQRNQKRMDQQTAADEALFHGGDTVLIRVPQRCRTKPVPFLCLAGFVRRLLSCTGSAGKQFLSEAPPTRSDASSAGRFLGALLLRLGLAFGDTARICVCGTHLTQATLQHHIFVVPINCSNIPSGRSVGSADMIA